MSHKVCLLSLSWQLHAYMNILGRGPTSTCEKDHFPPTVGRDIHEKQPWPSQLLSITTGHCLYPAHVLPTSSPLDFQQGCCICNAFSTHWANELRVAKAACNFLMSPCFRAGNMLLPPTPCSSVKTIHYVSLDPGSCCRENIITYQQCEAPSPPLLIHPEAYFYKEQRICFEDKVVKPKKICN